MADWAEWLKKHPTFHAMLMVADREGVKREFLMGDEAVTSYIENNLFLLLDYEKLHTPKK